MIWPVLLLIPVGFLIAFPITAIMRSLGHKLGTLDSAGSSGHEKELRQIPNTGGVAIFTAVCAPIAIAIVMLFLFGRDFWVERLPSLDLHWERLLGPREDGLPTVYTAIALIASVAVLHVMGLLDDRKSVGALTKLGVQVALAAVLWIWFEVRLLEMLGPALSLIITIGWIVVITNAMNFLDNMDGLSAGVGAIAACFLLAATLVNQQWFIGCMLALLIGAQLGFLIYNFPPATIFMGDSGSLVIGFLLAVLTARTTYYHDSLGGGWYAVFMPMIVLAIPIYDLASVTLIRLKQGKSPLVGDQQHFSHRLVQRGLSKRGAVVIIWCFAAITGVGGISLGKLELWQAVMVFIQTGLLLVTLALLEHASRKSARKDEES